MEHDSGFLQRKVDAAQLLLSIDDAALLDAVYAVLMNANVPVDWYERMEDEEREAIRQSRAELAAGNVVAHEDLMKQMMGWTKK